MSKNQKKNRILNFEINSQNEGIEIHGNKEGFKYLINEIQNMISHNESHIHLMTESWGGDLSDEKIGENNELINHIKILFWCCGSQCEP